MFYKLFTLSEPLYSVNTPPLSSQNTKVTRLLYLVYSQAPFLTLFKKDLFIKE